MQYHGCFWPKPPSGPTPAMAAAQWEELVKVLWTSGVAGCGNYRWEEVCCSWLAAMQTYRQ